MATGLDDIIAATRQRVSEARRNADVRELERRAGKYRPRGFRRALEKAAHKGVAVIAELKKASPSKGLIRADFDPRGLATELAGAGASSLSVLTDEEFFQGSLENLKAASKASRLPCLRKDFIVDEFQILEGRAYRADAVLLIVAALQQRDLVRLVRFADDFGVDVLCEAHDEDELQRALDAGCGLIGINSRDLRTFEVDLNTAIQLAKMMPKNVVSVAESGINSGQDVARLRAAGYQAFLIGESLMKAASPGEALKALLAEASSPVELPS
jgi:indole-3-glycerol phosphate synthase